MSLHDNANLPEKAKKQYNFIPIKSSSKYFQNNYFSQIKNFWKYLRETPDLIYEILKVSNQNNLSSSFNNFINYCKKQVSNGLGNCFTYTLLKEEDLV